MSTDELHEAAREMLRVIEVLGAIHANGDAVNWRDYLEPILIDAYTQLDGALKTQEGLT